MTDKYDTRLGVWAMSFYSIDFQCFMGKWWLSVRILWWNWNNKQLKYVAANCMLHYEFSEYLFENKQTCHNSKFIRWSPHIIHLIIFFADKNFWIFKKAAFHM